MPGYGSPRLRPETARVQRTRGRGVSSDRPIAPTTRLSTDFALIHLSTLDGPAAIMRALARRIWFMPRRMPIVSPFALVALVSALAGILAAASADDQAQKTTNPQPVNNPQPAPAPQKPTNPLLDTSQQRLAPPPLPASPTPLTDYRQSVNPDLQRTSPARTDELPLFGFNYFEPARRAILARRAYFTRLVSGQERPPVDRQTMAGKNRDQLRSLYDNPNAALTQEEKDAVAALTPAQQLDLLLRQRDNKLSDAERIRYRALLNPPSQDAGNSQSGQPRTPQDEADKLTTEQKLDLIRRQKANQLTPDEKVKYGAFLAPGGATGARANRRQGAPGDGGSGTDAFGRGDTASGNALNGPNLPSDFTGRGFSGGAAQPGGDFAGQFAYPGQIGGPGTPLTGAANLRPYRYGSDQTTLYPGQQAPFGQFPMERAPDDLRIGAGASNAYGDIVDPIAQLYQNVSATVPVNYQLAGGDKLILRISSPVMAPIEIPLSVDPMGAVMVPNVGRIVVLGQTLSQAENAIASRLTRIYRNAQVSLSMKELRTIPVTVAGESFAPGTYQIPAVATAFNLIYATGGPSEEGSMRTVEVRRRGKLVGNHTIDFYKFLLTGDQTTDVQLEPGDVIYIPGRHGVITVSGEVRRPARFELTEQETLRELLQYAGGVKPSGVSQRVQVSTVQPGAARLLKDVDITVLDKGTPVPVYDGDTVDVFSVRATLTNIVSVEGAVDQPGQYAISPNMRVADLVERARGLLTEAYPTTAQLYRWNPDNTLTLITVNLEKALARDPAANVPLSRWDRLTVFTRQEIAWTGQREVTVRGAVKKPGIYYRSDNMRVRDLLMLAGGTLPEAYTDQAYLLHQRGDGSFGYDFVNLGAALKDDSKNNVLVQDKDVLAVYQANEAHFTPDHQVNIQGEVVTPGQYARGENMKLSDAIKIAGGLTPRAGERILIAHARRDEGTEPISATYSATSAIVTPDPALLDGDVVTIQGRGAYQDKPYVITITGAVNRPGPVVLSGPKVRLSEVVKQAGGLKPEAYPEGVEFFRSPSQLTTGTQTKIANVVNKLNDILNQAEKEREKARSDIERIKAVGKAGASSTPLAIPGITPSIEAPNPALAQGTASIFTHDLVTPARQLTPDDLMPQGNVAVDLAKAMQKPGGDDDLLMLDGDTITVPVRPTTVTVMGAVVQSRGVVYREGARIEYYLDEVGGYTADAAKDRVLVIRVGGGLAPIKQVKQFKPGDIIFVPTRVLAADITKRQNDYDSLFKNLTGSAIIFLVARKLLGF